MRVEDDDISLEVGLRIRDKGTVTVVVVGDEEKVSMVAVGDKVKADGVLVVRGGTS